jgi:glycosyltransferase involved in cell wall biosynthesis
MNGPLVTCVCITRNRRAWLPQAIACFELQTYVNRELLIVADGEDVSDLISSEDSRIRLLCCGTPLLIGPKRNWANERAQGELIAHWDDDDYSAPGRLTDQVARLEQTGEAVTGYYSMKFTDGVNWWRYVNSSLDSGHALGTSLLYRREYWESHPFGDFKTGEDQIFSVRAHQENQLTAADASSDLEPRCTAQDLMYGSIHAGNTSKKNTECAVWRKL